MVGRSSEESGRLLILVQRTACGHSSAIENVGVDHCRLDVLMSKEFLDGADVIAGREQVSSKAMAESVAGNMLIYGCQPCGFFDCYLKGSPAEMVAPYEHGSGVDGDVLGGEDILPDPFGAGVGVFPIEGEGQVDLSASVLQILLVDHLDTLKVALERRDQAIR